MSEAAMKGELSVSSDAALPYRYAAGRYGTRFLKGLKARKILASECDACGLVLVPPRIVCARCYRKMERFVQLPPTGTVTSFTQVTFPFIDPLTGQSRPVPYCYAMIRFDGAHNTFQYFLEEPDIRKIRIGLRVRAIFRKKRVGDLRDILTFRSEKEKPASRSSGGRRNTADRS